MIDFDKLSRIQLEEASDFLSNQFADIDQVDLVIQLGSGQTAVNLLDEEWARIPLQRMPHLPTEESVAKHKLEIVWGVLGGYRVLVYSGRYHLYEGYGQVPIILPIWAAAHCGARNFLFTNAAGAINNHFQPGQFMVITDHVNNLGISPLVGHQHLIKTPFVDMAEVYCPEMVSSFLKSASHEDTPMYQGVYMANIGPQFETPAEVHFAKLMGADAVGMSTVLESITAYALGGKVLAVSMVKNSAFGLGKKSADEASEIGKTFHKRLIAIIRRWVGCEAKSILSDVDESLTEDAG